MQAASFKELSDARVPNSSIHAIARVFDLELNAFKQDLATKNDAVILRADIVKLKAEIRSDMVELRTELKADMVELKAELRTEIHATSSSIARQMYLAILGQMAVLLGVVYFFVTQLR